MQTPVSTPNHGERHSVKTWGASTLRNSAARTDRRKPPDEGGGEDVHTKICVISLRCVRHRCARPRALLLHFGVLVHVGFQNSRGGGSEFEMNFKKNFEPLFETIFTMRLKWNFKSNVKRNLKSNFKLNLEKCFGRPKRFGRPTIVGRPPMSGRPNILDASSTRRCTSSAIPKVY